MESLVVRIFCDECNTELDIEAYNSENLNSLELKNEGTTVHYEHLCDKCFKLRLKQLEVE